MNLPYDVTNFHSRHNFVSLTYPRVHMSPPFSIAICNMLLLLDTSITRNMNPAVKLSGLFAIVPVWDVSFERITHSSLKLFKSSPFLNWL